MATGTFKLTQQSGQFSGGPHTDFPAYFKPSATSMGSLTQAEADSIRVYIDAALTTEIPREVVSDDEIRFKVPSFSSGDEIYVDIDGTRSDYAETDTNGAQNVWNSNYSSLWHKNQDPSGTAPQIIDSTSNNNDGTSSGAMTSGDLVTGKIGQAIDYDGSDDDISFGDDASLKPTTITISSWIKLNSTISGQANDFPGIFTKRDQGNSDGYGYWFANRDSGRIDVALHDGTSTNFYEHDVSSFTWNGTWHKVTTTYDKSNVRLYVDGSEVTDSGQAATHDIGHTTNNAYIAAIEGGNNLGGVIDEIYVKSTAHSSNWELTEYNNQNAPGTFWAVEEVTTTRRIFNIT